MMKIDHFRARAINHSVLFTYMRPIHPPWSAAARRVPRVSGQGWLRGVILVQQSKLKITSAHNDISLMWKL